MIDHPVFDDAAEGALLVLGASGCLGGALVASALEAGRPVIAIGRDAETLDALQAQHAGAPPAPRPPARRWWRWRHRWRATPKRSTWPLGCAPSDGRSAA
jgi:NAD(P)-dependent dehydrogenase (short-subunit alcohol dehydrogenase family)